MKAITRHMWTLLPIAAVAALVLSWGRYPTGPAALLAAALLAGAVLGAVHHAEVLALRVGEPFGSLLLAVAVTVIEVGLIVTLTVAGDGNASLARDTVFAAVLITTNGIIGAALLVATLRGRIAVFNAEGSGAMLACVTAVAVLCLVMPNYTSSSPGPTFSQGQLAFAAVASLGLYVLFVFVQAVRHRDQFEPLSSDSVSVGDAAAVPGKPQVLRSSVLLVVALVGVVGLAKTISSAMESAVVDAGLPVAFVGVLIALLVLLPEGITAIRSARVAGGDVQRSFNLAYGSAMASIGLTIPVVAVISIVFDMRLLLGLESADTLLLALTVAVSVLTVTPGRATLLQAGVHLTLFTSFIALSIMP